MCNESHSEKKNMITAPELKQKILQFVSDECDSRSFIDVFIQILERREILKQVAAQINGPLSDKEIKKILIASSLFNNREIRVLIIDEELNGYSFRSQDSICSKLYYKYRIDVDPNFTDPFGCEIDKDCQSAVVSLIINKNGELEVTHIKFYFLM